MSTSDENYILKLNPPKELQELLSKRINADIENKTSYTFDEISDELIYIFGEDWRLWLVKKLTPMSLNSDGIDKNTGCFVSSAGIVLSVMLSKRGYAYNDGHCLLQSNLSPGYSDYTRKQAELANSIIEREIQKRYPELEAPLGEGAADIECRSFENHTKTVVGSIIILVLAAALIVLSVGFYQVAVVIGVVFAVFLLCLCTVVIKEKIDIGNQVKMEPSGRRQIILKALTIEGVLLLVGGVIALMCVASL